jgi:hypothetical protein
MNDNLKICPPAPHLPDPKNPKPRGLNYRINRWYDDLDDTHPMLRFLLFVALVLLPTIAIPVFGISDVESTFWFALLVLVVVSSRGFYFRESRKDHS